MKRSPSYLLLPLIFVLLSAALLLPVLADIRRAVVGDPTTPFADALTQFYPFRTFGNEELQQGRLPLWNPFLLSGYSLLGEGQAGLFYPLNLILAPLSAPVALNLFAVAHLAAAGIFFNLYLRACGLGRFGAFLGGFVYLFSSAPLSRLFAGHYSMMPFLALVPALLWSWERWRNDRGWQPVIAGALAVGCLVLAGYPQLLLYASLYLGWHALAEAAAELRARGLRPALAPLGYCAAVIALGACLGAVQLLPSFAFARDSFRPQFTYEAIAIFSFSPENLLTLLLPRFFGNLAAGPSPYWGRHLLWENWIYIGVVPLALAVLAVVRVRRPPVVVHALAVPVFLVLALGSHTPVHRLLYDHVPLFNLFRGSSKFSLFVLLSLATLAATGADRLLRAADAAELRRDRSVAGTALAAFAALGVVLWIVLGGDPAAEGSTLSRFVQWRLAQGETYLPYASLAAADLAQVRGQILPQLVRLVSLSLAGALLVVCWPLVRRSSLAACAALSLAVCPDLIQFCAAESLKAPVDTYAVAPAVLDAVKSDPARQRVLAPGLIQNAFLPHRVESPLGLVGLMSRRYNNFLTAVNGADRSASMIETPVLRLTPQHLWPAVSHLVLGERDRLPAEVAAPLLVGEGQVLYRLRNIQPRAAFARRVSLHASAESALSELESGSVDLALTHLLEVPEGVARLPFEPPAAGDTIDIVESLPMRTVIRTRTTGARLLVLADSFDPGWKCRLEDGTPLEIHPVNVAFRGTRVPPGDHTVIFSYEPVTFRVGVAMSALALLGVVAGMVLLPVSGKDSGSPGAPKEGLRGKPGDEDA